MTTEAKPKKKTMCRGDIVTDGRKTCVFISRRRCMAVVIEGDSVVHATGKLQSVPVESLSMTATYQEGKKHETPAKG